MSARILVVEDDPPIASVLERGLALAGYAVEVAEDGPSGLARWMGGDWSAVVPPLGSPEAVHLRLSEPGSVEPAARTRSRTQCRGHVAAGSART